MSPPRALGRALKREVRRELDCSDLGWSTAQLELLRLVKRQPGVTIKQAADVLHLADNTVSTLVTSLVELESLRRVVSQRDARFVGLFLTPRARQITARWTDERERVLTAALAPLSPEDQERLAQVTGAFERLVDAVDNPNRPLE